MENSPCEVGGANEKWAVLRKSAQSLGKGDGVHEKWAWPKKKGAWLMKNNLRLRRLSNKNIKRSLSFYLCSTKTYKPRTKFQNTICEHTRW